MIQCRKLILFEIYKKTIKVITERDKDIILRLAKKYRVSSVLLFGSSIEKYLGTL